MTANVVKKYVYIYIQYMYVYEIFCGYVDQITVYPTHMAGDGSQSNSLYIHSPQDTQWQLLDPGAVFHSLSPLTNPHVSLARQQPISTAGLPEFNQKSCALNEYPIATLIYLFILHISWIVQGYSEVDGNVWKSYVTTVWDPFAASKQTAMVEGAEKRRAIRSEYGDAL